MANKHYSGVISNVKQPKSGHGVKPKGAGPSHDVHPVKPVKIYAKSKGLKGG